MHRIINLFSVFSVFLWPVDIPVDTEGISCGNTSVPVSTPLHFMQLHLRFPKGNLQVSSNRCVVRGLRRDEVTPESDRTPAGRSGVPSGTPR